MGTKCCIVTTQRQSHPVDAPTTHSNVTPIRSDWLPTQEACDQIGVTRRTLQRRANEGRIETRQNAEDGRTYYKVRATPLRQRRTPCLTLSHQRDAAPSWPICELDSSTPNVEQRLRSTGPNWLQLTPPNTPPRSRSSRA